MNPQDAQALHQLSYSLVSFLSIEAVDWEESGPPSDDLLDKVKGEIPYLRQALARAAIPHGQHDVFDAIEKGIVNLYHKIKTNLEAAGWPANKTPFAEVFGIAGVRYKAYSAADFEALEKIAEAELEKLRWPLESLIPENGLLDAGAELGLKGLNYKKKSTPQDPLVSHLMTLIANANLRGKRGQKEVVENELKRLMGDKSSGFSKRAEEELGQVDDLIKRIKNAFQYRSRQKG